MATLDDLLRELSACRICRDAPVYGRALPHEPRPVIQASPTARLCIASQAPGTRVHLSGRPFTDASGVQVARLARPRRGELLRRAPGGDRADGPLLSGAGRQGRRSAAAARMRSACGANASSPRCPALELILLIGQYAQAWHLGRRGEGRPHGDGRPLARDSRRRASPRAIAAASSVLAQQWLAEGPSLVRGGARAGLAGEGAATRRRLKPARRASCFVAARPRSQRRIRSQDRVDLGRRRRGASHLIVRVQRPCRPRFIGRSGLFAVNALECDGKARSAP